MEVNLRINKFIFRWNNPNALTAMTPADHYKIPVLVKFAHTHKVRGWIEGIMFPREPSVVPVIPQTVVLQEFFK